MWAEGARVCLDQSLRLLTLRRHKAALRGIRPQRPHCQMRGAGTSTVRSGTGKPGPLHVTQHNEAHDDSPPTGGTDTSWRFPNSTEHLLTAVAGYETAVLW